MSSLVTNLKTGNTRALTQTQVPEMMSIGVIHKGVITIKFKKDSEGLRLAKKYAKLAKNPSIALTVKFEKII